MSLKNLPVILSLLAGFVACIATFIYQYDGTSWLWIVIGALVLFYILGLCLRKLFFVVLAVKDEDEASEETESEDKEETDEGTEGTDAQN
jgi:phosphotransferase system  glucose/maltose/N-acetylglucosamine-specific IIC component